jgi:AraC-like DNA-binding protein
MDFASNLDLIFRGGALSFCAIIAVQMCRQKPRTLTGVICATFMQCTAAYVFYPMLRVAFDPVTTQTGATAAAINIVQFNGFMTVVAFWMFARALASDQYRIGVLEAVVIVTTALFYIPICMVELPFAGVIKLTHIAYSLALVADALRVTIFNFRDDLVENRRQLSKALLCIIPVTGLVISGFVFLEAFEMETAVPMFLQSGAVLATLFAFLMSISSLRDNLLSVPATTKPVSDTTLNPADRLELNRLRAMMEHGVYLEPNLTIGSLAAKMHIPEHRLRKLINNHLGHRNFAAFINDQRIEEAKRRLGNGDLAREQITGLAFDLGFASLAPFNRAFRDRVGMSPSEYRTKALTLVIANGGHPLHS